MPDCGTQAVPPAAAPLAPSDASRVELPCFQADTCHVHVNIPPCDTLGHRADSWNVAKPDYTCELRGFTRGDTFLLRLLTQDAGELFAEATWEPDRPMAAFIDAAADSSRYFALRIENAETRQHVFIGIGFNDREIASQLKLTLSEHGKYLARRKRALQEARSGSRGASSSQGAPLAPMRDLSLKGSVYVAVPGAGASAMQRSGSAGAARQSGDRPSLVQVNSDGSARLAPPPGRARRSRAVDAATEAQDISAPSATATVDAQCLPAGAPAGTQSEVMINAQASGEGAEQYDDDDFGAFVG